jgi:hypothetical protein
MKNVGISLKKIEKKCNPTFLKNVATFCKMLTKIVDEINIFNVDKNVGTFLKNDGRSKRKC